MTDSMLRYKGLKIYQEHNAYVVALSEDYIFDELKYAKEFIDQIIDLKGIEYFRRYM